MNRLLTLTAIIEAATGLALMAVPPVVVRLLLGGEISGASIPLGRVAGLLALAGDGVLAGTQRHRQHGSCPPGNPDLQFTGDALFASPRCRG